MHILFYTLVSMNKLRDKCLNSTNFDQSSNEYKLNSIILDIANCRMFLPVKSDFSNVSTDKFLKLKFANKGIDTLNIGNILNHKEVTKHIPAYFKCQATPKISYTYSYHTLIFDLMSSRNMYLYNAYIYTYILF